MSGPFVGNCAAVSRVLRGGQIAGTIKPSSRQEGTAARRPFGRSEQNFGDRLGGFTSQRLDQRLAVSQACRLAVINGWPFVRNLPQALAEAV